MSPKTLLDIKEEPREELNQTSATNDNNQADLIMENNQKSDDLILNLGSNLKDNLMAHFSKFSTLLKGVPMNADDKKKLIEMNRSLLHRLSFLFLGDYVNTMRDNLDSIDKDLLVDLTRDECGLFYELESTTRSNIVNLLMENVSSLCLLNDSLTDEYKENLIKQNNDLAHRLLDLKVKPFCGGLNAIKHGEIEGDETEESDNRQSKTIKSSELNDLKEKLESYEEKLESYEKKLESYEEKSESYEEMLESKIRAIDVRSNEITFRHVIEDAEQFLKTRKVFNSEEFFCSSIKWYLEVRSNHEEDGKKWVGLYLHVKVDDNQIDWSIIASNELEIVHPSDDKLNESKPDKNKEFKKESFTGWASVNLYLTTI